MLAQEKQQWNSSFNATSFPETAPRSWGEETNTTIKKEEKKRKDTTKT